MGAFPFDTATTQHELIQAQFINKQAAMYIDGSWTVGAMTNPDNVVILPIPSTGNGKTDVTQMIASFSSGFYITRKAWDDPAKRDTAVKFVQAMTSTESIAEFVTVAGGGSPAAVVDQVIILNAQ